MGGDEAHQATWYYNYCLECGQGIISEESAIKTGLFRMITSPSACVFFFFVSKKMTIQLKGRQYSKSSWTTQAELISLLYQISLDECLKSPILCIFLVFPFHFRHM